MVDVSKSMGWTFKKLVFTPFAGTYHSFRRSNGVRFSRRRGSSDWVHPIFDPNSFTVGKVCVFIWVVHVSTSKILKYFPWHLWEPTKNHKRLGFHQLDSVRFVHDESIPGNPWFLTSNNMMGIFFQTYVVLHFESSPVSSLKRQTRL